MSGPPCRSSPWCSLSPRPAELLGDPLARPAKSSIGPHVPEGDEAVRMAPAGVARQVVRHARGHPGGRAPRPCRSRRRRSARSPLDQGVPVLADVLQVHHAVDDHGVFLVSSSACSQEVGIVPEPAERQPRMSLARARRQPALPNRPTVSLPRARASRVRWPGSWRAAAWSGSRCGGRRRCARARRAGGSASRSR